MDVAFDAVHADIRLLCVKLSGLDKDILCKSSSLPAAETTANFLCQQCEVSLQFLLSLCQQKLFRDRLLKNKVHVSGIIFGLHFQFYSFLLYEHFYVMLLEMHSGV